MDHWHEWNASVIYSFSFIFHGKYKNALGLTKYSISLLLEQMYEETSFCDKDLAQHIEIGTYQVCSFLFLRMNVKSFCVSSLAPDVRVKLRY